MIQQIYYTDDSPGAVDPVTKTIVGNDIIEAYAPDLVDSLNNIWGGSGSPFLFQKQDQP